jgi:hypothetical protein
MSVYCLLKEVNADFVGSEIDLFSLVLWGSVNFGVFFPSESLCHSLAYLGNCSENVYFCLQFNCAKLNI